MNTKFTVSATKNTITFTKPALNQIVAGNVAEYAI